MAISPARLGLLHTEFAILRQLFSGPIERERIATLTGIPAVTCARLLLALEKGGWAMRAGLSGSTGGRRRLLWIPAVGTKLVAGLHIEVDRVTATLVDLTGKVLESRSRRLQVGESGDAFVASVLEPLREVAAAGHLKKQPDRLLGGSLGSGDGGSGGRIAWHLRLSQRCEMVAGLPASTKAGKKIPCAVFP